MSKPFSDVDLSNLLTEDRTWRIKEISDLKSAIIRADMIEKRVLLRALVTICYAHWEGYVRLAARRYLEHIALRRLSYGELNRQFLRNYFLPRLAAVSINNMSIADRCTLIDDILSSSGKKFSRVNENLINTRSNLNFEVFSAICLICDILITPYESKQTFIDVILLKRRNAIAHGEDTFVEVSDLELVANDTVNLMRSFGDDLDNRAALKAYRA